MLDSELEKDSRWGKQTACRGEGLNLFRGKKKEMEVKEIEEFLDLSGSKDGFLGRSLGKAAGLGKGRLKLHVPPAATRLTTVKFCSFSFDRTTDSDLDGCRKCPGEISYHL